MRTMVFRYRPAVRAHASDKLPFRVDWRLGRLAGISTNNPDDAEISCRDRKAQGYEVIESDSVSQRKQGLETHRERQ
jgi:hypothetical protein